MNIIVKILKFKNRSHHLKVLQIKIFGYWENYLKSRIIYLEFLGKRHLLLKHVL